MSRLVVLLIKYSSSEAAKYCRENVGNISSGSTQNWFTINMNIPIGYHISIIAKSYRMKCVNITGKVNTFLFSEFM